MNTTNAEYFTFNVHNSMLLIGQTGTGKSILVDKLLERLVAAHKPQDLRFVLLDMTGVDFWDLRVKHPHYIDSDIKFASEPALAMLEHLANMSEIRVTSTGNFPALYVLIEECDMAALDQKRFEKAVITINKNAKAARMKLIFSTSRPSSDIVSGELAGSFDLILAGHLVRVDRDRLELPVPKDLGQFDFTVTEN